MSGYSKIVEPHAMPPTAPHTLTIGNFRLTVLGHEFPEHTDYWDGNWLLIEATCTDANATAHLSGPCVRTDEIARLTKELQASHDGNTSHRRIDLMEQELAFQLSGGAPSRTTLDVSMLCETGLHHFTFELDAAALAAAIRDCRTILAAYPIRDAG